MSEDRLPNNKTSPVLRTGLGVFYARRPHALPAVIAAAMLFAAMGKWPYDYYRILRWVVCAAAIFVAYQGWTFRKNWASWLFGFVAVLFNPVVPVRFGRGTWQVIDLVAAAVFLAALLVVSRPSSSDKGGGPAG